MLSLRVVTQMGRMLCTRHAQVASSLAMSHVHPMWAAEPQADRVGFIGLGAMGFEMAKNLVAAKVPLAVYDVNKDVISKFLDTAGGDVVVADSPADVVDAAPSKVITMLPNNDIVKDVYAKLGARALENGVKNALWVDCSTVLPGVSQGISKDVDQVASFVDAPVSGGVTGAAAGTLTFMLGIPGKQESVTEGVKQLLSACGGNFFECGDVGAGGIAKLSNNMLLGT